MNVYELEASLTLDTSEYESALEGAQNAADGFQTESESTLDQTLNLDSSSFDEGMNNATGETRDLGNAAQTTSGEFTGAFGSMANAIVAGGVAGLMSEVVGLAKDLGEYIVDSAEEWGQAMGIIAAGTGLTGDALDGLTTNAANANAAIADSSTSLADTAAITAELNTRLGLTGEEAENTTEIFGHFAKATGQDAATAVDSVVDAMKLWGENLDEQSIVAFMDDLTTSSQACKISADDMNKIIYDSAGAFQNVGMDAQDAMGFIAAFADAGGHTQNVTKGMQTAMSQLTKATDNIPGAFNEAMDKINSANGDFSVLQDTIGDTGLTVEDVFGRKFAQDLVQAAADGGIAIDEFTSSLDSNQGAMESTYENTVTLKDEWSRLGESFKASIGQTLAPGLTDLVGGFADLMEGSTSAQDAIGQMFSGLGELYAGCDEGTEKFSTWQTNVETTQQNSSEMWTTMAQNALGRFSEIYGGASTQSGATYTAWTGKMETMKSTVKTKLEGMKTTIATKWDSMKTTISTKTSGWATTFGSGIQTLKDKLNFSWSLPTLKMPHISITGDWGFNPPRVPSFGISWYAKAMQSAYVVDAPTIFPNGIGAGEAGREVVSGEDHLVDLINKSTAQAMTEAMSPIYDLLSRYLPECAADKSININGREFGRAVRSYV